MSDLGLHSLSSILLGVFRQKCININCWYSSVLPGEIIQMSKQNRFPWRNNKNNVLAIPLSKFKVMDMTRPTDPRLGCLPMTV